MNDEERKRKSYFKTIWQIIKYDDQIDAEEYAILQYVNI